MEKYFTPSIEDLRIGYECETQVNPYPDWLPTKLDMGEDIQFVQDKEWRIRVSYLTKEQIEAEGWEVTKREVKPPPYQIDWVVAKKGHCALYINLAYTNIMHLQIDKNYPYSQVLFRGQCKDVNTFRTICKLLKI